MNNSQAVEIEEEESSVTEKSPMPQSPIASTSQQSFPPQHPRQRAKSSEYLINEASKQMKDTFNTLNNVLKDRRTEEDECDLYCKLLAKKLRGLSENERAIFMYEIDGMFIKRLRNLSTPSSNFYIPERPTSSQSCDSEPSHNEMRTPKRPNSSFTSYSEPAIPSKIVPNHNNMSAQITYPPVFQYIPIPDRSPIGNSQRPVSSHSSYSDPIRHTPKQQNTARMPSPKPTIAPNHTISLQTTYPPVLHIPDPNHNPNDNSQSVTILSDQVIVSPARDYFENFKYSQE